MVRLTKEEVAEAQRPQDPSHLTYENILFLVQLSIQTIMQDTRKKVPHMKAGSKIRTEDIRPTYQLHELRLNRLDITEMVIGVQCLLARLKQSHVLNLPLEDLIETNMTVGYTAAIVNRHLGDS